mgnify:FL=1
MKTETRRVEGNTYPDRVQMLQGKTLVNFDILEVVRDGEVMYNYEQALLQIDAPEELIAKTIEEETQRLASERKVVELDTIKVRISTGKLFYGDSISRIDINDAITLAKEKGQTTTLWKLAEEIDGSKITEVTVDELKEALGLSLEAKARIIGVV